MAPSNNRAAHWLALKNGWYRYFDADVGAPLSCDPSHPEARLDIVRGLAALRGEDPGPATAETHRAQLELHRKNPRWMRTSEVSR